MSATLYRHTTGRVVAVGVGTRMAALMDRSPDWAELDQDRPDDDPDTDGPDDGRPADTAHVKTWAAYARSLGIEVPTGTGRADIIAAVDAALAADAAENPAE